MLEIKNLKVVSAESHNVLIESANLRMQEGRAYVLEGRNGSGKSSLMNAIMGHPGYEIIDGQISVDDREVKVNSVADSVKADIYMAMQHVPEIEGVSLIQLLHKSIGKRGNGMNILELNKTLESYCEEFGIDKSFVQRDLNYKMSGGEKKQAELLHLLALAPQYILIDEIDSGVDKSSIDKIFKVLNYLLARGSSLLIVSHHTNIDEYLEVEAKYSIENKILQ